MQLNRYRVLLATPEGLDNTAFMIAADRAGTLGILEGTRSDTRDRAIRRIREYKIRSFAVKTELCEVCEDWLEKADESLITVVCSVRGTPEELTGEVRSDSCQRPPDALRGHIRGRGSVRGECRMRRTDRGGQ